MRRRAAGAGSAVGLPDPAGVHPAPVRARGRGGRSVWLFSRAFERRGWHERARRLREGGVRLTDDGSFGEYYQPFTGEPRKSVDQSWTAAVVLDWLCTR